MNLAANAIQKRAITYFGVLLILAGGVFSYFQLGQLEDPEFTVKTAAIVTTYPGASAEQVELDRQGAALELDGPAQPGIRGGQDAPPQVRALATGVDVGVQVVDGQWVSGSTPGRGGAVVTLIRAPRGRYNETPELTR